MKRVTFTIAVLLFSMMGSLISAQTKEKDDIIVESDAIWQNWFVSAGVGTSIFMGDSDRYEALGYRFAPAIDLSIGKWFTPYIGARLQYSGPQLKGYTLNENGKFAYGSSTEEGRYKEKWNYMHFHIDGMLNLSNVIGGYNDKRLYSFIPYAGAGYARNEAGIDEITIQMGLHNSFRINSSLNLFLDVRGTILGDDKFDYFASGIAADAMITATVGVTYQLSKKGWKKPTNNYTPNVDQSIINNQNSEIEAYKSQLANSENMNKVLREQLASTESEAQSRTKVVREIQIPSIIILFDIGRSELSKIAMVNLKSVAKVINESSSDNKFTIVGCADNLTGNKELNDKLSRDRADAVFNYLTKESGVDSSKLVVNSMGGIDNLFFDDNTLSRVVIIE